MEVIFGLDSVWIGQTSRESIWLRTEEEEERRERERERGKMGFKL